MAVKTNSFEGGTNGTGITSGNSGGASGDAFDFLVIGTGATVTFDNTRAAHGTLSARVTPTASQTANGNWQGLNTTDFAIRKYIYLTAATTDDTYWFRSSNAGGGTRLVSLHGDSAGRLVLRTPSATVWTSTSTVPLNQWVRIEMYAHIGTGTTDGKVAAAFYSADSTTPIDSFTNNALNMGTTAIDQIGFLKYNNQAYATAFWVDDLRIDTAATGLLGPVGSNAAPTVNPPAAQRIATGNTASMTMTATDSDGTIASRSWVVTSYPSGAAAPTLSGGSTATATTSTLTVPGVYTFTPSATDNGGTTTTGSPAIVYVYAADGSAKVRARRSGSTWTGAVADVNDTNDATYLESPASPSNVIVTLDMDPVGPGDVTVPVRARLQPAGGAASTCKIDILTGSSDTVAATRTVSLTDSWVTTTVTLSSGENAAMTDHSLWAVRLTANQT